MILMKMLFYYSTWIKIIFSEGLSVFIYDKFNLSEKSHNLGHIKTEEQYLIMN